MAAEVAAVEGPAWLLPGFEAQGTARRGTILESARAVEHEGALPGASAHISPGGQRP